MDGGKDEVFFTRGREAMEDLGLRRGDFPARISALVMTTMASSAGRGDGRLWGIALGLSLMVNVSLLALLGIASVRSSRFREKPVPAAPPPSVTTVILSPEQVQAVVAAPPKSEAAPPSEAAASPPAVQKPRFTRTSDEQISATPPENPAFIGERNTIATSDRAPDPTAPPLPSQAGIERDEMETTTSDYQDGRAESIVPKPEPIIPTIPEEVLQSLPEKPIAPKPAPQPAKKATLATSSQPVDVPVPAPAPNPIPKAPSPPAAVPKPPPAPPKVPPSADPAFRGNQKKTAIVGSISRTGPSALDVVDSPLGRYQAVISRAVEEEWQRNCMRHRDFITPGFLTVRFYVEATGKVRTVQFVGEMETGEVQKGFTLNSIRDAAIPPMPAAVRKDLGKDPLEIVFNFYF